MTQSDPLQSIENSGRKIDSQGLKKPGGIAAVKRLFKLIKNPLDACSDRFFRPASLKGEKRVEEKRREVTFGSFGQPKEQKTATDPPVGNFIKRDEHLSQRETALSVPLVSQRNKKIATDPPVAQSGKSSRQKPPP